jgi:hypothetical protein
VSDADPDQPRRRVPQRRSSQPSIDPWNAVGTLLAGLAFWGLIGFGIDRLFGLGTVFLPIGLLVGIAAALYLVIYQLTHKR